MRAAQRVLIVNADDLGRTAGIDEAVFTAHEHGIVRSATLMVGGAHAAAAAARSRGLPELGLGLHFQLTGGVPLSPPAEVTSLVDADGRFARSPDGLGNVRRDEVAGELARQWRRFEELVGAAPMHIDSHHHVHRRPEVLAAVIEVATAAGVPVRNAGGGQAELLHAAGLRCPDHFIESFFGEGVSAAALDAILDGLAPGVSELMCHPGRADDADLAAESSYVEPRELERELLSRPGLAARLVAAGVRLAGFADAWSL